MLNYTNEEMLGVHTHKRPTMSLQRRNGNVVQQQQPEINACCVEKKRAWPQQTRIKDEW